MTRRLAALLLGAALLTSSAPAALAVGVANDDAYSVGEDATLTVPAASGVLLNDVPGLAVATAVLDAPPASATSFELAADGSFSYTPAADFNGTDTFTYHTLDTLAEPSNVATVTITVDPVNDPPVASDVAGPACNPELFGGSFPIPEDWGPFVLLPGSCGLAATDVDGDDVDFLLVDPPAHGSAEVEPEDGFATYTPDPDFSTPAGDWLSDAFTYKATDGVADSTPATVRLWIAPVNDPPTFTPGSASVEVGEDSGAYSAPWATDIDPGAPNETEQAVTFDVTVRPEDEQAFAELPAIAPDGTLTFTPAPGAVWLAEVTVFARDDGGLEDYGLPEVGPDDTSDAVEFAIVIAAENDAPTGADQAVDATEDTSKPIDLGGTDPDGDTLTFTPSDPTHGTVTLGARVCAGTPSTCVQNATYTPDPDYFGADSFTYTVSDGTSTSAAATVSITVAGTPDSPTATNDALPAVEDGGPVTIDPRTNDADADGDALSVTAVTQGAKGSVTFTAAGVTYTPAADAFGADAFSYTIGDGTGRTDTATVSVTIAAVNDPPTIGRAWRLYGPEDGGATTRKARTILTAGGGETGQTLTAHVVSNSNAALFSSQPVMTVAPGGINVTWTPAANRNGRALIRFVIRDSGGTANGGTNQSAERWFWITVMPVNDDPNAVNDVSFTVKRNAGPTALDVLANDTTAPDVDEVLVIVGATNGANGTVALTGGGTGLTYRPNTGFIGTDTFTYTISDGRGGTDTATVLVTVVP